MFSLFTINKGCCHPDPINGKDSYHVLEYRKKDAFIYMRPDDLAIEFIVEANYRYDNIMYFPTGLTLDTNVTGVSDF